TVKSDEDKTGLEIYTNGGYFQDISQLLGSEYYFSAGLLYKASHHLDVHAGGFYNIILMKDVLLEPGISSTAFYGLELGLSFYPLGKMPIKPFLGVNTAITLFPHPFSKNSLRLGFKFPIPKIVSFTLYYSLNHTVSNMLNNYTSHLGGATFTVSIM
ncbi:MAG: hypothetical protein OEZ36_11635, partial [Spirochaetota bacterium]|nr:hypothetical protein [Spirochaetota bacterium]